MTKCLQHQGPKRHRLPVARRDGGAGEALACFQDEPCPLSASAPAASLASGVSVVVGSGRVRSAATLEKLLLLLLLLRRSPRSTPGCCPACLLAAPQLSIRFRLSLCL